MVSQREARDLLISMAVLSFAFYNAFGIDILTAVTVTALAFILHELSHRYVARRYGCFAEFRMWTWGVVLALASSFAGFLFAAPGAVYISPYSKESSFAFRVSHLTKKEYGKISLAGTFTNIVVGSASLAVSLFSTIPLFRTLASISFFLAAFNLLPIFPLDGSKVFAWDRKIWLTAFAAAIIGVISSTLA